MWETIPFLDRIYKEKYDRQELRGIIEDYKIINDYKTSDNPLRVIVYMGCYGTAYWRVFKPYMKLIEKYKDIDISIGISIMPSDIDNYDVFVFQRVASPKVCEIIKKLKEAGKKVIFETDDYLHNTPEYNPAKENEKNKEYMESMSEIIRISDLLTVSTDFLKQEYLQMNSNIKVLPNCVNEEHWAGNINNKKLDSNIITIGWSGSNTHSKDLEIVTDALAELINNDKKLRLLTIGWDGKTKIRTKEGIKFYDAFSKIDDNKKLCFSWSDYPHRVEKYMRFVDIGIAPLLYNNFNKCKSNVKFLEYSMLDIPTIATDIEPYQNTTSTLIKNNRYDKWYKKIKEMIENKEHRINEGIKSHQYTLDNFNIDTKVHLWYDMLKSIANNI